MPSLRLTTVIVFEEQCYVGVIHLENPMRKVMGSCTGGAKVEIFEGFVVNGMRVASCERSEDQMQPVQDWVKRVASADFFDLDSDDTPQSEETGEIDGVSSGYYPLNYGTQKGNHQGKGNPKKNQLR